MNPIDQDIEEIRGHVQDAWDAGNWFLWFMASCILSGFRIAKKIGAR